MTAKRRPGRPPRAGKTATEVVKLRVTTAERRAWEKLAKDLGFTLSDLIRMRMNWTAKEQP